MKRENLKIAYVGGGSRGWAWQLMRDLALEGALSGEVALYDIDREAAACNERIGNRIAHLPGCAGKWHYKAYDEIGPALTKADFVVISILPGTFDEMESDVHAPEKYGIFQSVGDSTGPGGLVRSLRTGPMICEIARAVETYCPAAWVINYTNPMALCMRALYSAFPGIRAFGCCHEVFSTQQLMARALGTEMGIEGVERHQIFTEVMGVNHFTWITRARFGELDLYPMYQNLAEKYLDEGYYADDGEQHTKSVFRCKNKVKFDLFLRNGVIAAAGDRHLAEFCPGERYLKNLETAEAFGFTLTPVSWRKKDLLERLETAAKIESGEEPFDLKPSGEEGVKMIKALLGLGDLVTNVNMPNRGQIVNAPRGAIVETNALLNAAGAQPVFAGHMPAEPLALSMPAIEAQAVVMEAINARDARIAFPAFANDPLVNGLSTADAKALYRTMLENTKAYLAGWTL